MAKQSVKLPRMSAISALATPDGAHDMIMRLEDIDLDGLSSTNVKLHEGLVEAAYKRFEELAGQPLAEWINGTSAQVSAAVPVAEPTPEPAVSEPAVDPLLLLVEQAIADAAQELEMHELWRQQAAELAQVCAELHQAYLKAKGELDGRVKAETVVYDAAAQNLRTQIMQVAGVSAKSRERARLLLAQLGDKVASIEQKFAAERTELPKQLETRFGARFDAAARAFELAAKQSVELFGESKLAKQAEGTWAELHKGQTMRVESFSVFVRRAYTEMGRPLPQKGG